jgi:DNA-binding NtrC family response regulator
MSNSDAKGKILVIEPDEAYLDIEQYFTAQGYEVFGVIDAPAALALISLVGMPEVVVMGYRLADTRGSKLARRIQDMAKAYPPWIVQLTSYVHYSYGDSSIAYIDTNEIRLRIRYFLECHQKAQENKGTILLVEPDNDCRLLVHQILEADGFTVMSTADVEIGTGYAELNLPDLIIYGVVHRSVEYHETKMWARKEVTRYVDILIMYETYEPDNILREYVGNFVGAIQKPIHPMGLRYNVRQTMRYVAKMRYFKWKRNLLQPLE